MLRCTYQTMLPFGSVSWPRWIGWLRALLAATAIVGFYTAPVSTPLVLYGVLGAFLLYSVVRAVRRRYLKSGAFSLLGLFGDTIYFLVLASFGGEHTLWISSMFYLLLVAEAVSFYAAVETCIVVGVCALFCALVPYDAVFRLERTVITAGVLACGFAFKKQRLEILTSKLSTELKERRLETEKAVENERQRIASDFHDGPLQSFISLHMRLDVLRKLLERDFEAGLEDLKQLQSLAQSQITELRAFLHSMRPVDVDGANLMASARRTAESFQKESGIPVTFLGTTAPVGLPQEMSAEVLQMLKEALHNVQKHAGATRVAVSMEKRDRALEISIDDNGHGFSFAGSYSLEELELLRLGPASLKRRARALNAEMLLESRPGRGAGLKLRIPLQ